MATPEKPLPYPLAVLAVESCTPTVEHEGKIYARLIQAKDINNQSFTIRERTGIEAENYIGKQLECVLEIVKATFYDPEDEKNKKIPAGAIKGEFVGSETGYKFFPELVTMVDGETGNADDDDFNEDEYDTLATKLFAEWGVYGFGLDVYQDKPMIKTEDGVFFLNEYIFEEWIDKWEEASTIKKPVCFVVEELLLHGIKPHTGEWKPKHEVKEEEPLKPYEMLIVGRPKIIDPW
ncbi:MAG: hypothetical protein LBV74_16330 [Tannerella sp.]|jgi:hypothetical protein|nr:hypothetical protein [Tannerella sp.]